MDIAEAEEVLVRYFDRLCITSQYIVDKHLFNEPEFFVKRIPGIENHLVVRLVDYVWSEKLDSMTIKYPKDWKQAFKERWYPKWALHKWPVQYTEKTLSVKRYYPEWRDPQQGKYLTFVDLTTVWRNEE